MANRICPVCGKVVPASSVLALSDGLECPHCHSRLEVSTASRMLPTWGGLLAAYLVWRLTSSTTGLLSWVLPEFYAIVTFGAVAALLILFSAKLNVAPAPAPAAAAPAAAHGHH